MWYAEPCQYGYGMLPLYLDSWHLLITQMSSGIQQTRPSSRRADTPSLKGTQNKGQIAVRTRQDDEYVEISISDSGTGIPPGVREKIFDPFFTTKEVGKGTGQGLTLARAIVVEKHGGTLTFETEIGKGTTFHVRLPVSGSAEPREAVAK